MKITDDIRISDNGFIFNSKTGDSFNVNLTGLELIKMIKQGSESDAIKNMFLEQYELDELAFEKDFYEFCALIKYHQIAFVEDSLNFN